MRVGCHALTRPLSQDTPRVWLIDHTIQIGDRKLLIIAGCRLADVPFGERALRVEDLTLIGLAAVKSSTASLVAVELDKAAQRTGTPRAIVSDDGGDLNGAVATFRLTHAQTAHIHDTAHRAANILKNRWEKDARWAAFVGAMASVAPRIRQTAEAYLLPPRPRTEARFMKVGPPLRFARRVLGLPGKATAEPKTRQRYGWLEGYRETLAGWQEEYQIVQAAVRRIRVDGGMLRSCP
ncbi:MAG: hypothetical protein ACRC33_16965 [Gemmataceae bacterium]